MGFIRTLLALVVVLGHVPGAPALVGGRNAVQMFYVISGFLMSYVLVERFSYRSTTAFYVNRYLRLYPIYLTVIALTSVSCLAFATRPQLWAVYQQAPWSASVWLVLSNLLMVGQDWIMFAGVQAHQLVFSANFRESEVALWQGLLAPQAWTLGVELTFYLIAPFILTRRSWLWGLLVLSLVLRMYLIKVGVGMNDPWDYRFFPAELALFVSGALVHQLVRPWYARLWDERMQFKLGLWACAMLSLAILFYPYIPLPALLKSAALFALFLPCLPLIFVVQSQSRLDRSVGELSYPIYIGHWLIIETVQEMLTEPLDGPILMACVIGATLAFAYALNRWIGTPVEHWRDRLRSKSV